MNQKSIKGNKSKKKKYAIIISGFIFIFIVSAFGGYIYSQLGSMQKGNISKNDIELGIDDTTQHELEEKAKVTNILLLGVDKEENASDAIMVLSIDETHKKLKLTSIMRDSYVNLGQGKEPKLNYAYNYGGPQLSVKTINENYRLDIRDYVMVSFDELIGIIDAFGGIKVQVKDYEIEEMATVGIKKAGTYNLNGKQALVYSRIRHEGNQDYERTQRQRLILEKIFEKIKVQGPSNYPSLISKLLPLVETSLDKSEILSLGLKVSSIGAGTLEQTRVPFDKYKSDYTAPNGRYYLKWDKEHTIDILHKFIYEDIQPQ